MNTGSAHMAISQKRWRPLSVFLTRRIRIKRSRFIALTAKPRIWDRLPLLCWLPSSYIPLSPPRGFLTRIWLFPLLHGPPFLHFDSASPSVYLSPEISAYKPGIKPIAFLQEVRLRHRLSESRRSRWIRCEASIHLSPDRPDVVNHPSNSFKPSKQQHFPSQTSTKPRHQTKLGHGQRATKKHSVTYFNFLTRRI